MKNNSKFSIFKIGLYGESLRNLFLFHKQLPIVYRLAARRRQSDKELSRQFFQAKNRNF